MTTPTPPIPSFTDGPPLHANSLNALASNIQNLYNYTMGGFLTTPPFCIANQTTAQSISNTTFTSLNFNSTIVNTGNMWVASQPSQITIQTAGVYLMTAQVTWATNGTGFRETYISINGSAIGRASVGGQAGGDVAANCTSFYRLASGAVVTLPAWQNSGGALATAGSVGLIATFLSALWISQ